MEGIHLTICFCNEETFFLVHYFALISPLGSVNSLMKEKQNNAEMCNTQAWYEVTDCGCYIITGNFQDGIKLWGQWEHSLETHCRNCSQHPTED